MQQEEDALSRYEFCTISAQELDEFSAHHPQGNFQQTSQMGALRRDDGVEVESVGVRQNGTLVAAAQVETHRSSLSTFCEVHDGPLCDFHDEELVRTFTEGVRNIARSKGAAQVSISPEYVFRERTSEGDALPADEGGLPDIESFTSLRRAGFEHDGFTRGYTAVPRWRYVKDVDGFGSTNELLSSYSKNTRRNVRIAQNSAVHVRRLGREELDVFHDVCSLSCERQGFQNRDLAYFQKIFDDFGEQAEFLAAYIDMDAYVESWKRKQAGYLADIKKLTASREGSSHPQSVDKKIASAQQAYESSFRRLEQAQEYIERDGRQPVVAVGLFIWHEREAVYLFSGSDDRYAKFYAPTALQHHVMSACLERGVDRYNFYGIDGVFDDPDDPGRGVLEFKQGFNGHVVEMPGEFTLVVRPVVYRAKRLAHKLLGR